MSVVVSSPTIGSATSFVRQPGDRDSQDHGEVHGPGLQYARRVPAYFGKACAVTFVNVAIPLETPSTEGRIDNGSG